MDGILALCHFCETHGPCVLFCTQRFKTNRFLLNHATNASFCESCQSIGLTEMLKSYDGQQAYISTRVAMQQDHAFLLKHAAVRSLSCEEYNNKEGGSLYFGDNERGHVYSHAFTLQDSLARGFNRKYCILLFMRDKIHLLNSWPNLQIHITQIADYLREKAAEINGQEQETQSQRSVRQHQVLPATSARSLSHLTGNPSIFATLHQWFTWILSAKFIVEQINSNTIIFEPPTPSCYLRSLLKEMGETVFTALAYCTLTGEYINLEDERITQAFQSLLPNKSWPLFSNNSIKCTFESESWQFKCSDYKRPEKLPNLLENIIKSLKDEKLSNKALEYHLSYLISNWWGIAKALVNTSIISLNLLHSLGVQKCDFPLLEFWTRYCIDNPAKHPLLWHSIKMVYQ